MFESINIDFDYWVRVILNFMFQIVKIPFVFWNDLPSWIRWSVYSFIFIFALFMAWLTWKGRNEWRYRY